jgi:hypothetical protein
MIDRRLQLLLLMNCHPCCATCFSERLDDIAAAIESGDCYLTSAGDGCAADGIYASRSGAALLRSCQILPDAVA